MRRILDVGGLVRMAHHTTVCAYLSVLPVYAYLSIPTICACLCYCLYLPVCNLGERSARLKALPNSIDRLIVLIRIILYGRSLVVVWGASLGGLDSIRRRADIEALVQFDRSIESFVALNGRSNGGLVLATVV